jgi:hypothetical protein
LDHNEQHNSQLVAIFKKYSNYSMPWCQLVLVMALNGYVGFESTYNFMKLDIHAPWKFATRFGTSCTLSCD